MQKVHHEAAAPVRRNRRRLLTPVVVAAVLAVALCTTAFAANIFGIRDIFEPLFMSSEVEMNGEQLSKLVGITEDAVKDTEIGPMPAVTSNGTTITPIAAVYEEEQFYLALRIEAPEGVVFDREESFYQISGDTAEESAHIYYPDADNAPEWRHPEMPWEAIDNMYRGPDGKGRGTDGYSLSTMFHDDTPGDNVVTLIVQIMAPVASEPTADGLPLPNSSPAGGDLTFDEDFSAMLRFSGIWLQTPDKVYTKILDGVWEFDIGRYGVPGSRASFEAAHGALPTAEMP